MQRLAAWCSQVPAKLPPADDLLRSCLPAVARCAAAQQKVQTFVSGVSSQRGTLPWTAPEILRTPDAVTEKIDVFSFGVVRSRPGLKIYAAELLFYAAGGRPSAVPHTASPPACMPACLPCRLCGSCGHPRSRTRA